MATEHEESHQAISEGILDSIQESLNQGRFGNSGMVSSFITIVEVTYADGETGISVLYNDKRLTTLLGLLSYGGMWAHQHSLRGDNR